MNDSAPQTEPRANDAVRRASVQDLEAAVAALALFFMLAGATRHLFTRQWPGPIGAWLIGANVLPPVMVGAGFILLLMAVRVFSRPYAAWRLGAGLLLVTLGIAAFPAAMHSSQSHVINPRFHYTLYQIERLSALTEQWIAEHHRAPTESEWKALIPPAERLDGWGHALHCVVLTPQAISSRENCVTLLPSPQVRKAVAAFGYAIVSERDRREGIGLRDINTWQLGLDGVFGSSDDDGALRYALRKGYLDPHRYPHGRAPREVPPDAH